MTSGSEDGNNKVRDGLDVGGHRSRKTFSCIPCRNRKVKCDKNIVCSNCTRRGEKCEWSSTAVVANPNGPGEVLVKELQMLQEKQRRDQLALPDSMGLPFGLKKSRRSRSDNPYAEEDVDAHESFDHSILSKPVGDIPPPEDPFPVITARDHREYVESKKRRYSNINGTPTATPSDVYPSPRPHPFGARADLTSILERIPDRPVSDHLVTTYLERVEWMHHPLHVPSFLNEYNAFWEAPRETPPSWLALLFAVLCLGLHFSESDDTDAAFEEVFYDACTDALGLADFMYNHSIEALQTLICLILYLHNTNRSEVGTMYLGLAVKMAQTMGLSRVPEEPQVQPQLQPVGKKNKATKNGSPPPPPPGLLNREMKRRLWWSLVSQDGYASSSCHCTYSIHLQQCTTTYFANVDDEELLDEGAYVNHPMSHATSAAFHLSKLPFALLTRKFIDAVNESYPTPSYSTILELDAEYRALFQELPNYLRADLPQPLTASQTFSLKSLPWQRTFLGITLHNRIMRLHRPYMVRGYRDASFAFSTRACLDSARALLNLVAQARANGFPGMKWWVVLVQTWTAGLAVCVDLLHDPNPLSDSETIQKRAQVELAITLLKHTRSQVAERAIGILQNLLNKDFARRTTDHPQLPPPPPPANGFNGGIVLPTSESLMTPLPTVDDVLLASRSSLPTNLPPLLPDTAAPAANGTFDPSELDQLLLFDMSQNWIPSSSIAAVATSSTPNDAPLAEFFQGNTEFWNPFFHSSGDII